YDSIECRGAAPRVPSLWVERAGFEPAARCVNIGLAFLRRLQSTSLPPLHGGVSARRQLLQGCSGPYPLASYVGPSSSPVRLKVRRVVEHGTQVVLRIVAANLNSKSRDVGEDIGCLGRRRFALQHVSCGLQSPFALWRTLPAWRPRLRLGLSLITNDG